MAVSVLFTARNGLFLERNGPFLEILLEILEISSRRDASYASAIRAEELLSVSVIRTFTDYPW